MKNIIRLAVLGCVWEWPWARIDVRQRNRTDPLGALIPSAKVPSRKSETGASAPEVRRAAQGRYAFLQLQPGTYRLAQR